MNTRQLTSAMSGPILSPHQRTILVLDVDGPIYHGGKLDNYVLNLLGKVARNGVHLCLLTGRGEEFLPTLRTIADTIETAAPMGNISIGMENGAVFVFDYRLCTVLKLEIMEGYALDENLRNFAQTLYLNEVNLQIRRTMMSFVSKLETRHDAFVIEVRSLKETFDSYLATQGLEEVFFTNITYIALDVQTHFTKRNGVLRFLMYVGKAVDYIDRLISVGDSHSDLHMAEGAREFGIQDVTHVHVGEKPFDGVPDGIVLKPYLGQFSNGTRQALKDVFSL